MRRPHLWNFHLRPVPGRQQQPPFIRLEGGLATRGKIARTRGGTHLRGHSPQLQIVAESNSLIGPSKRVQAGLVATFPEPPPRIRPAVASQLRGNEPTKSSLFHRHKRTASCVSTPCPLEHTHNLHMEMVHITTATHHHLSRSRLRWH